MQEKKSPILLVANGDLRLSANQKCWEAQCKMESKLVNVISKLGWEVQRAHDFDETKKHGFIDSQKMGIEVFKSIDPQKPILIAEAVWQYSQHLLPGLFTHKAPILTLANWSGTWPGLVGMLNLNASLTKMGVSYSTLWSETFEDSFFKNGIQQWLSKGILHHDQNHVFDLHADFKILKLSAEEERFVKMAARDFVASKPILGIFDEGCMGMYNAIIPDEFLHPIGVFKERLSQSALYAATQKVPRSEAIEIYKWLKMKGMRFELGEDDSKDLTEDQVLKQCQMYIAAVRLAHEFGCSAIGIQYQQGLKDLLPASDLVEGLLNNSLRPPVFEIGSNKILFENEPIPHFNEVDECAGLDALITHRLWKRLGFPPENTLHDLRWGEHYRGEGVDDYVWVFLISGAAPPAHFINGFRGTISERQPPMYFRLGGGTIKGISKPGHIVWSRIFIMDSKLHCDLGIAEVVFLPDAETQRRWRETTPQWPIMHVVLKGISRDQMMARHKSNHIQVVYAPNENQANRACRIKAAFFVQLGFEVHLCGEVSLK